MSPLAEVGMMQNVIPIDITPPTEHINTFNQMEQEFKEKSNDWENLQLKEYGLRPAMGVVESNYFVPFISFEKKLDKLIEETHELTRWSKQVFGKYQKFANINLAHSVNRSFKHLLQTVCGPTSRNSLHRDKRFISLFLFFIFTTIAVVGISTAVASSSRLLTKEDIQSANETAVEQLQLTRAEVKRLEKNSKRIDSLEDRADNIEKRAIINNQARKLAQAAQTESRELESILNPEKIRFEDSYFMKHMALDIRSYYTATNNDLFEHVVGTGISDVFFFTKFETIVLKDGNSNSCDEGFVMIKATTINPIMDIVGTPTTEPQRYQTKDGRYFYIKKDFILDGSPFRPVESLSSQRLVITTKKISVTVLNNTVFMIQNNDLNLNINITCAGKNVTQETLYKNPFLRLHTSCEVSSEHLNISTFTREYQRDENVDALKFFDNIDEESDFQIGYHKTNIRDKHDISEMFDKANDIFAKETEILQHEMQKLEQDTSIGKIIERAGGAFTEWFNKSLHVILGAIVYIAIPIIIILVLVIIIKCCGCCAKKQNCETQVEAPTPPVPTSQEEEKTEIVVTD